ncbi:carcinoembryonic antigen-related cell adhesion molecule 1-like isoform X2 [Onychostoma macrolepis]|uniref:carcinoembryonic antigen-related cell adhesion molecule 1-like isoform X2 n=1 Tax=Onychostoma macrolepis TaxID=369639 RepID=UPI00272BDC93|nr:carcinoembryonic antigen-related cell adhesion molecule 1-like isoform X2 [Onychostoma macrolepis]
MLHSFFIFIFSGEKRGKMNLLFILLLVILFLLDHGVSGVFTDSVSVSIKEGDSVTLNTDVQTNQQEEIRWHFNDNLIAKINGYISYICTDVQCNEDSERFRDRLKLDNQTGSLTITNVTTSDSGEYKVMIFSNGEKIFSVSVTGFPASELVKKREGESVTLHPDEIKNPNYVMRWYFNDTVITEITRDQSKICTDIQYNEGTERFRDRLQLDHQTGSLTITDTRTTDSGDYKLQIISRNSSFSITRMNIFSVSVTDSGLSSGAVAGIVIVVLLAAAAAVAAGVFYYRRSSTTE